MSARRSVLSWNQPLKLSIGVDDECGEVLAAVLGPHARRAVSIPYRGAVPAGHRVGVRCDEGDVRARGHTVAARLRAEAVQAEVVAPFAAEQHVRIVLELAFAEDGEAEVAERPRTSRGSRSCR